jgi:hypothetical protein
MATAAAQSGEYNSSLGQQLQRRVAQGAKIEELTLRVVRLEEQNHTVQQKF